MPKSTGIYKRKLNSGWRYYASVYYKTKKYNVPGGHRKESEAKVARAEFLKKLASNELTQKKKITVEEYSKIFLENYGSHWRTSTFIAKKSYVNQYINLAIGSKQMNQVTPLDIQGIKKKLDEKGCGKGFSYNVLTFTKLFFETAVHWEFTSRNPAYSLRVPKKPQPRKTDVDPYKIIEIIDDIKSARDKTIIALGIYGGLRLSEVFALQRKHVDIKNSTLNIENQYTKGMLGPPKSESSQATIDILPLLSKILGEWVLQCGSPTWLFPGRKPGYPLRGDTWQSKCYKPLMLSYGFEITFRTLRTLHAILLRDMGMPVDFIQKQLRHASYSTTADFYSKVPEKQLKKEIDRISNLLVSFPTKKTPKMGNKNI